MRLDYDKIRQQRRKKALSVVAFAKSIGFSPSYVSQIERGIITPSVSALQKIAEALEVPMASFWEQDRADSASQPGYCEIVRASERKVFRYPHSSVDYELLSPSFQCKIELLHFVAKPGQISTVIKHVGEEAGIVIRGTLELWVGNRKCTLKAGDSIYYDSDVPHHWRVAGDEEVEIVWAVVPPSF